MLRRNRRRIINLFKKNYGYMTYSELMENEVTIVQLQTLVKEGAVERFARGCYWCRECELEKPEKHKYIEIYMANPGSIMCLETACYLNDLIKWEPEVIQVSTLRTDRKKLEMPFPTKRYYLQSSGFYSESKLERTYYGDFRYYSPARTICDCLRMKDKVSKETYDMAVEQYCTNRTIRGYVKRYAEILRAKKNVNCFDDQIIYERGFS